jgi:hypothetical protein
MRKETKANEGGRRARDDEGGRKRAAEEAREGRGEGGGERR